MGRRLDRIRLLLLAGRDDRRRVVDGDPTFTPPYSYYAAFPTRPRIYVGYGDDSFPFQGQPYGQPYDRWSWTYMAGGYSPTARYFYPPLR